MRIFRSPRDIVWGRGAFSHLEKLPGKRALVVTDRVMTSLGVTARAKDYLRKGGMEPRVFDDVEPEPSIGTVMKIVEQHRDFRPDVIVGVGGGSSIDASKAFRIFFEHPHLTFEALRSPESPDKTPIPGFEKTLHVAVASTSGTGSDVSRICVVTDPAISAKCAIWSYEIIPNVSIVDPDIADTMPPQVAADSGLDALTHAIESYVSTLASDFTRGLSLQAIASIMSHLPSAFGANDPAAKEHVHYAATIAGLAFSNSANGICHTIAGKVGIAFGLTHGRANAVALPYTIKFNSRVAGDLFAAAARLLGFQGEDPDQAVEDLIQRICAMRRRLNVPGSYREAGIPESEYRSKIEASAAQACAASPTLLNPRRPTPEEMTSLLRACYRGDYGSL